MDQENKSITLDDLKFIIRRFLIEFGDKFMEGLKAFLKEKNLLEQDGALDNTDIGEVLETEKVLETEEELLYDKIKNFLKKDNHALKNGEDVREYVSGYIMNLDKENEKNIEEGTKVTIEEYSYNYWNYDEERAQKLLSLIRRYRHKSDQGIEKHYSITVKGINDVGNRYISELIQNADDCKYESENNILYIHLYQDALVFRYNERGFTPRNILAITTIGDSDKADDPTKTGEKGRGFKTVFSKHDKVIVQSGHFHFSFERKNVFDLNIDTFGDKIDGTRIIAYFKDKKEKENLREIIQSFITSDDSFFSPILFTQNISKIKFFDCDREVDFEKAEDLTPFSTLEKEAKQKEEIEIELFKELTKESRELLKGRYPNWDESLISEKGLLEKLKIKIIPCPENYLKHEKNLKGHIYTSLPTSTDINIPFAINAPFSLNVNRAFPPICVSEKETEDEELKKWNAHLLRRIFEKNGKLSKWIEEKVKNSGKDIFYYLPNGEFKFLEKDGIVDNVTISAMENLNTWYGKNQEYLINFQDLEVFKSWKQNESQENKFCSLKNAVFFEQPWMYELYNHCVEPEISKWIENSIINKRKLCKNPLFEMNDDDNNILRERTKSYIKSNQNSIIAEKDFVREIVKEIGKTEQKFKKEFLELIKKTYIKEKNEKITFFRIFLKVLYSTIEEKKLEKIKEKIFPYWKNGEELCFENFQNENECEKIWFINLTGCEYRKSYDKSELKILVLNGNGKDLGIDDLINKYSDDRKISICEKVNKSDLEDYIGLKILNGMIVEGK